MSKRLKVLSTIEVDNDGIHCGPCEWRGEGGEGNQKYQVCNLFDCETVAPSYDVDAKRCVDCLDGDVKG